MTRNECGPSYLLFAIRVTFTDPALLHHPGPVEHDPRHDVLTSAKRAAGRKHAKYVRGKGVYLDTFRARDDGRARGR